jgi:CBS domain-containing protein
MKVSELMSQRVVAVRVTDHASVAGRLMWDRDCGSVPVLDHDDRAIAMITDRDICMATIHQDRPPSAIAVWEAMSKTLYSCGPDDSVGSVEEVMRKFQIRRVPVLNLERRLIGILSLADVVRATEGRKVDEVTATLANICAPRRTSTSSAAASA